MTSRVPWLAVVAGCVLVSACDPAKPKAHCESSRPLPMGLSPLPPLVGAPTTLDRTLAAPAVTKAPENPALAPDPASALGSAASAPPWPAVVHTPNGKPPPKPGQAPRRLVRFVHLTDAHVADDESPTRLGTYDQPGDTHAALRPQDGYGCRMLLAAARTTRALHDRDRLAFVLLGGDTIDSAQDNELGWSLDILAGSSRVECDSGADDDPVPGPANDGKDAFASAGVGAPFLWVNGNHEALVQGIFPIDERQRALALGTQAPRGTRNYALAGAPAQTGGFVVADSRRALLSRRELLAHVHAHGNGHGIGARQVQAERATYAWDPPGSTVRIVVIDTAHAEGGAAGVLTRRDVDGSIVPLLDSAAAEHKLVLLASHHSTEALGADGGTFGSPEPDALSEAEWLDVLGRYPNVIASFVGHSHRHGVRLLQAGARPFWEITTAALIDFPNQLRLVELFDQDDGWLTVHATVVDLDTTGDPVGEEARRRARIDFVSGWQPDGRGAADRRNVVLWVKKP